MITEGQIYEQAVARDGQHPTRIVIKGVTPYGSAQWGSGTAQVATLLSNGREVRPRKIKLTELHASRTTRDGQPRRNGYVLRVSADDWNAAHPVGTPVTAYPGFRPEVGGADVPTLHTRTRSRAWNLGPEPVVMVDGYAGGISLEHIDLRDEPPTELALRDAMPGEALPPLPDSAYGPGASPLTAAEKTS